MYSVYKHPPLAEALCEFHFDPSSPWDVTIFGHFYDRIKDDFSEKRQLPEVAMSLQRNRQGVAGEIRDTGIRMQFIRPDHSAIVQLSPHLLVINKLPPYESWHVFKAFILAQLGEYQEVVGSRMIIRVELRYINRFMFPAEDFFVGSRLGQSEYLPARLMKSEAPFFSRLEMPQTENNRLLLTIGTIEAEEQNEITILLDIAYLIRAPDKLEPEVLDKALDDAHDCIEEAFESCLTQDLRQHFNREE